MQIASITSLLKPARFCILVAVTSLSLQVIAAGEMYPAGSAGESSREQAMQGPERSDGVATVNQDEPIEEVTVIEQRLISTLRLEVIRAEDRAFDLFNALNDDDQYDIHCRMEAPTGTRIRYRQCAPNFFVKTEAHATQTALSGGYMEVRPILAVKYKELKEQMMKKTLEHPELLDAFLQAQELREELGYTITSYWDRKSRTP